MPYCKQYGHIQCCFLGLQAVIFFHARGDLSKLLSKRQKTRVAWQRMWRVVLALKIFNTDNQ